MVLYSLAQLEQSPSRLAGMDAQMESKLRAAAYVMMEEIGGKNGLKV